MITACSDNDILEPVIEEDPTNCLLSEIPDNQAKALVLTEEEKQFVEYQILGVSTIDGFINKKSVTNNYPNESFTNLLDYFSSVSFACNFSTSQKDINNLYIQYINFWYPIENNLYQSVDTSSVNKFLSKLYHHLSSTDKSTFQLSHKTIWIKENCKIADIERFDNLAALYEKELKTITGSKSSIYYIKQWIDEINPIYSPHLTDDVWSKKLYYNISDFKFTWLIDFNKIESYPFTNEDNTTTYVQLMSNPDVLFEVKTVDGIGDFIEIPLGNQSYSIYFTKDDADGTGKSKLSKLIKHPQIIMSNFKDCKSHLASFSMPKFNIAEFQRYYVYKTVVGYASEPFNVPELNSDFHYADNQYNFASISFDMSGVYKSPESKFAISSKDNVKEEDFILDKPFAFFITEKSTGIILYVGNVTGFK